MTIQNPDFPWYVKQSKELNLTPRCPIASAELCPRYFATLSLLGKEGITTDVSPEDHARLEKKWKPFAPTVAEEDVGITKTGDQFRSISGACPEVSFEVFGYFASDLHRYADEDDHDLAHKRLGEEGVDRSDFRWQWSVVQPHHYTECREYSIQIDTRVGKSKNLRKNRLGLTAKVRWQVLARDAFACQYCGRRPPEVSLEVDHRISVADGGTDDLDNLFSACTECNRGKGAQSVTENG
jgi:hypothetical protein